MELVELQSRAGLEQDANLAATQDDLNEARNATGIKKKGTSLAIVHPHSHYYPHPAKL